jgi:YVTN family beta-propeller protein
VACRGSNYIAVIDVVKRGISANIKTGTGPTGLAISPDGSKLFAAIAKENLISVFETATKKSVAEVKLPLDVDFPGALAFLPDGKRLVVSSASTSNIGILDTEKLEFQCQPEIGHGSDEVLWAPVD